MNLCRRLPRRLVPCRIRRQRRAADGRAPTGIDLAERQRRVRGCIVVPVDSSMLLLPLDGYFDFQRGTHPVRGRHGGGEGTVNIREAFGNIGVGHAFRQLAMDAMRGHMNVRYAAWVIP